MFEPSPFSDLGKSCPADWVRTRQKPVLGHADETSFVDNPDVDFAVHSDPDACGVSCDSDHRQQEHEQIPRLAKTLPNSGLVQRPGHLDAR
jgi:hypothetical protein